MRTNIMHIGAGELTYEIRNIVRIAEKMQNMGIKINLENIGDPVAKGERIPGWIKEIVSDLSLEDASYSYCPPRASWKPVNTWRPGTTGKAARRFNLMTSSFSTASGTPSPRSTDSSAAPPGS